MTQGGDDMAARSLYAQKIVNQVRGLNEDEMLVIDEYLPAAHVWNILKRGLGPTRHYRTVRDFFRRKTYIIRVR